MSDRSELISLIDTARSNPGNIQRAMISQVERTYNGELEVLDPMNPFVFLLEAAATVGAAGMFQAEELTRQQYPNMALSSEELYRHMSDVDYIGRFSNPARTSISILLGKEEVMQKAVPVGTGNVRKLTIPRHTKITVAGVVFTMQYPIDIRVMGHGGLEIVYDGDQPSPISTLESNKVTWSVENYNTEHNDFLRIDIPILQFRIDSYNASLNGTTRFKKTYPLQDQFYYCRVYLADMTGNWKEILTTHSDQVFDPLRATAVLRVVDETLTVSIPQVYYTTGLINTELRVDIYTTKGPLEMSLSSYPANNFVAKWIDLDKTDDNRFSAPLANMSTITVLSDQMVTGGANSLTFEELRERAMNNTLGPNDLPITNAQITTRLSDLGYSSVVNVDNITNRIFLATRQLPKPSLGTVSAGAGAAMGMLSNTLAEIAKRAAVADNGARLTLKPEMLYLSTNGILSMVDEDELARLRGLSLDLLAAEVSAKDYLYSPFHYVLDTSESTFRTRPYYFNAPDIVSKYFLADNDTTGFGCSSGSHQFVRTTTGWKLLVETSSSDAFKELPDDEVFVQLMFKPAGESDGAYLNGRQVAINPDTKERIFQFDIFTNWDVDSLHNLSITNFTMYEDVQRTFATPLITDFNLIYIVANHVIEGQAESWIDTQTGKHLLPATNVGIYQERLKCSLGSNLDGLWTRARSVAGSLTYLRYAADVPAVREGDRLAKDEANQSIIKIVDGKLEFEYVWRKGDLITDDAGNQVMAHFKGDVVRDENGDPVTTDGRSMLRQMDLFLLDGVYYFATAQSDVAYRESVPQTIVGWLTDDLVPVSKKLLEQTKLYFHPKATIGLVNVIVKENEAKQLPAAQQLSLTYYVTRAGYMDADLRAALTETGTSVIADLFLKPKVAKMNILSTLETKVGGDAQAIELHGLGGDADYEVVSITDDSGRLCIGQKLVSLPDDTLAVQDAIQTNFVLHVDA